MINPGTCMSLDRGQLMPMFTTHDEVTGGVVHYQDVWQRRNLVLAVIPPGGHERERYARELLSARAAVEADEGVLVISAGIAGLPGLAAVVADRWGEVYFVSQPARLPDLPHSDELLDWLRFVRNECPECQGEVR